VKKYIPRRTFYHHAFMSSYCLFILLKALVWMDSYDLYLFVTYLKMSLLRAPPYDSENSMFFIMTLGYSLLYGVIIWFLLNKKSKVYFEVDRKKCFVVATIAIAISFILLNLNIGVL